MRALCAEEIRKVSGAGLPGVDKVRGRSRDFKVAEGRNGNGVRGDGSGRGSFDDKASRLKACGR
jgi:hypothetical protein